MRSRRWAARQLLDPSTSPTRSYLDLVDVTVKEFGRLDGLFNVAADLSPTTLSQDTDVLSVSLEVWRHTIDVTLTGYMYGIRHALPIMIDQGGGAIVNTMSTSVWMGEDNPHRLPIRQGGPLWAHPPHRHARRQARRALQLRCARSDPHRGGAGEYQRGVSQRDPRIGALESPRRPRGPRSMVAFLFSDDGAYVTGQTILVDGGANFT